MQRHRNMIAAVLLLCAVELHSFGVVAAQNQTCAPSQEEACFVPADYLNALGPVHVEVCAGKKLNIPLEHVPAYKACHWIRGAEPVLTVNGSSSMVLPPLSETDSGEYTLSCETNSETRSSVSVSLHVAMERPTKPKLALDRVKEQKKSPYFTCISEGCPKPKLELSGNKKWTNVATDSDKVQITISSVNYHNTGMMCCATNAEGQECSQLYDYDLKTDSHEFPNVTVSPGESLLLRCRIQDYWRPSPVWEKGSERMDAETLACPSKVKEEICIKNDSDSGTKMAYLFIESVSVDHSGTYTCRSKDYTPVKSVYIHVQTEDFISVQLDESKIIPAQNATILEASVSYHPVLQHCSWESPNNIKTKCIRDDWVTKHRTVKLHGPLISGDYKLHLQAGEQNLTKIISVCTVDTPKFRFWFTYDTFTFETASLVPANYTWKSCSSINDSSCDRDSSWTEIPDAFQTDSDAVCNKTIRSSLRSELVEGDQLRFCLTNSIGTWCETKHAITRLPSLLAVSGSDPNNDDSLMVLKVSSLLLLVALAVVCVVLTYFVRKKRPKYQPQLQMIQVVGPNDNDYIYINFKDFTYDPKLEFPRENLELGDELGSGAFGMVVQATAYGINKPGVSQQVAVKMLKEKHQDVEKEALMSELKMLTHIGHHANIVNLLGACTETGPIYLIFQYCCYGDLLNYLKKNRERYHKSVTDAFNKDRFSSLYHNLQPRKSPSVTDTAMDTYVTMHSSTTRGQEDIALLTLNSGGMDSFEDSDIFENQDDPTEDLQTLTFDDLLNFAYQVAKGMEFLSSKNCIHRDLAARNVLVTKGRLVKIGDFGLARDIENDSNYVVRGNVRLPVKWMAPESTFQGIYTMKSDVWAYGILLWEIFSLGVTPYPGMKVDHTFYSMIERGFKMECPYYANETVYGMMCKCWALDPCNRPSFSKQVSFMYDQLTDREEMIYHNMLNQTPSEYQNASTILDISALAKQSESKTQSANDYRQTHATEESKEGMSDLDVVAAEDELLKPSDAE
ncbi:receptor-type tyrosine-protein kinase FLT3 isoform X1 [Dicentrarchus labrax]|uniref:receptor-type tyrosine-protein kinase FLT3 isoform X1 n=1 Tax=Dicentrarchus labrax TaxID=13489 RepID=UPI0021F55B8F|nr:receptor-type tyrosine-protein kinase FLT3 isoform X1 [Dicentrarchus labrax]